MNDENPFGSRLRAVLTSRQRQDLINQRERGWLNELHALGVDVGNHPFLGAGDSEVVEARFFEALRAGVSFERNLTEAEFIALCRSLNGDTILNRALVVFSPNPGVLGAFVADSRNVMPQLKALAATARFELAAMSLDAVHGLSLDRSSYSESGDFIPDGVLLLRAWGDFASCFDGLL